MTMVISPSPANRYISLLNCMCCAMLRDPRTKFTGSFTSVRRKRSHRHCLFRHCSGTVCPQKCTRRRKKHRCVHLRVSQEVIFDHWKPCDKPKSDTNDINDTKVLKEHLNAESKNTRILEEHEHGIAQNNASNMNALKNDEKTKDIDNGRKVDFELCIDELDLGSKRLLESLCVCKEPRVDYNLPRSSPKKVQSNQTFSQCANQLNISKEVANSNTKYIGEDISEVQRKDSLCELRKTNKYSGRKISFKRGSQSDTSINETITTDNTIDSSAYDKLHAKCVPSVKKKLSREFKFSIGNTKNNHLCQQSNVDETEDIFGNASSFSSGLKQKCELKHFTNKHRYNLKNNCTVTDRQNGDVSQKKLPKHFSRNCSCSINERDHNSPQQWNISQKVSSSKLYHHPRCKMFTNVRKGNCLCEYVKEKKKNNPSVADTRPSQYKAQSMHYKEKPTWIIFKNKESGRSRILGETKFDNSTYSSCSSSTIVTDITENSLQDDSINCWYPRCKSSRHVSSTNPRKYNKYNTSIDPNDLMSSSSVLSSPKRCHSWTILSQDCVYDEQRAGSSSSCTNIPRGKRRYLRNERKMRTYHTPTSSSCSLTSPPIYKDDYNLETSCTDYTMYNTLKENNRIFHEDVDGVGKLKRTRRSWKKPKCHEQEKGIIRMDERRVAWNI